MRWDRSVVVIAVLLATGLWTPPAKAQVEDAESLTIGRMIEAGLPEAAISYALARRELAADDPEAQSRWTLRLMHSYGQAAIRQSDQAATYWDLAQRALAEFQQRHPQNRRLPWLQWQAARCDFLRAQADLAAYLAAPANAARRESILALVREILQQLSSLDQEIKLRLQTAAQEGLQGGREAPADQLNQLSVDVALLRCETILVRSRLYAPESKDRIAAAAQLETEAQDVLSRTDRSWPSRQQLQIAHAAALLELGRSAEALQTLSELAMQGKSDSIRASAAQVAITYLCQIKAVSRAQAFLPALESSGPTRELALIQLALAELGDASPDSRDAVLKQVVAQAKQIGLRYGDYWHNRADALLVRAGGSSEASSASSTALDLVRVEVKQLLAAGDTSAAIARLKQRQEIESQAGNGPVAIALATEAAALESRESQLLKAAETLQTAAEQFTSERSAADAHQLAIIYLQQSLAADIQNATLRRRYEAALLRQLQLWPDAAGSGPPADWLGQWLLGQGRRREFLQALSRQASQATEPSAVEAILWRWLTELVSEPQGSKQIAAIADLREVDFGASPQRAQAAGLAANCGTLLCTWPSEGDRRAMLAELNSQAAALAPLWQADSPAWPELVTAIGMLEAVRSNDSAAAVRHNAAWAPAILSPKLRMAVGLAMLEAIDFTPASTHAEWAALLKFDPSWATLLQESQLPAWQAAGYRMLGWLGDAKQAIAGLEQLREKTPTDARILLQLAHALAEPSAGRLADSSRWAKRIVANTPPGTEPHIAARWRLIANLLVQGKQPEAGEQAQLFLAVSPPSDPIWRARFEALAKRP